MSFNGNGMRGNLLLLLCAVLFLGIDAAHVDAQPAGSLPRVGFISTTGTPAKPLPLFEAFRQGLRERGYIDGKNILIVQRYAEGRLDRMPALVNELVQEKVDVIVAVNNVVIKAAKEATKTIPIVMVSSVDPVTAGYVQSFARPGGNITGIAWLDRDVSAKRIELLKELLPKMSRIAVLWDGGGPGPKIAYTEYETATRRFKLELRSLEIRGPHPDLAGAFQNAKSARSDALIVVGNALMYQHANDVFSMAIKNRLPSMTEDRRYVDAGGLISYGASLADLYRRAADYVVDIIKGAKPGDLAIKLPERFELTVNLKTANQLNLNVPQHMMIQADAVIK